MKRLIKRYRDTGRLALRQRTVRGFARRYTQADIRLLATMDERHSTPNGLTLKKLCERAYAVFGQAEYERLAGISVSHLYNLRQSQTYRRRRHTVDKTRPVARDIGEGIQGTQYLIINRLYKRTHSDGGSPVESRGEGT